MILKEIGYRNTTSESEINCTFLKILMSPAYNKSIMASRTSNEPKLNFCGTQVYYSKNKCAYYLSVEYFIHRLFKIYVYSVHLFNESNDSSLLEAVDRDSRVHTCNDIL